MSTVTPWYLTMAHCTYNSHNFKIYYKSRGNQALLHPLAERMVKIIHTAILDDKDPRREVYMMIMTPKVLMKRFQRTYLRSIPAKPYSENKMAKEIDKVSKEKNKRDFDKRKKAKDKKI